MIYNTIKKIADEHYPLVELKLRINIARYLNDELIELQQDGDYFRQKIERTKDPGD